MESLEDILKGALLLKYVLGEEVVCDSGRERVYIVYRSVRFGCCASAGRCVLWFSCDRMHVQKRERRAEQDRRRFIALSRKLVQVERSICRWRAFFAPVFLTIIRYYATRRYSAMRSYEPALQQQWRSMACGEDEAGCALERRRRMGSQRRLAELVVELDLPIPRVNTT